MTLFLTLSTKRKTLSTILYFIRKQMLEHDMTIERYLYLVRNALIVPSDLSAKNYMRELTLFAYSIGCDTIRSADMYAAYKVLLAYPQTKDNMRQVFLTLLDEPDVAELVRPDRVFKIVKALTGVELRYYIFPPQ